MGIPLCTWSVPQRSFPNENNFFWGPLAMNDFDLLIVREFDFSIPAQRQAVIR